MRTSSVDSAFEELLAFLREYSLAHVAEEAAVVQGLRAVHRKVLPLLILRHRQAAFVLPGALPARQQVFDEYLAETISDVGQALLCTLQGMVKPANLALRSGIENFVRCIGLQRGVDVGACTTVHALMDAVAVAVAPVPPVKVHFDRLRQYYGDLCNFVHTSGPAFMTLSAAFSDLHVGKDPRHGSTLTAIAEVATSVVAVTVMSFREPFLRTFHPNERDQILDCLSLKDRRAVMEGM